MDEVDMALWGIGGIMLFLACTCYAIFNADRTRRGCALLLGTIALVLYIRQFATRLSDPDIIDPANT